MKRNFIKKLLLGLAFCTGFEVFAENAVVVSVTGKVEVQRNNAWVALLKDNQVGQGEMISTGFNSEAILNFDGHVIKLGPVTRVTLEKLSASEKRDDVSVYLNTGKVRSTVNHSQNKRSSYTVRNPIAVASVRGTDFDFYGNGTVSCYEGAVLVLPARAVDPRKNLGISHPADEIENPEESSDEQQNPEVEESADEIAETTLPPAEGESTAFTDGKDINPNLPKGVLITAGQNFSNDDNSNARGKGDAGTKTDAESFEDGVKTEGEKEGGNIASGSDVKQKTGIILGVKFIQN